MNILSEKNTKSQDFRRVYSNTISMVFAQSEVEMIFGIQSKPGTEDVTMEEQVGVIFTHSAAKLMAMMLTMVIADYEEATGAPVVFDQQKLTGLQTKIDANKAAREKTQKPPK